MEKEYTIEIYDKGKCIGKAIIEFDNESGALMAVYEIQFDDETVNVLFIKDMDYGIVIDKNIADRIREVCYE